MADPVARELDDLRIQRETIENNIKASQSRLAAIKAREAELTKAQPAAAKTAASS